MEIPVENVLFTERKYSLQLVKKKRTTATCFDALIPEHNFWVQWKFNKINNCTKCECAVGMYNTKKKKKTLTKAVSLATSIWVKL